MQDRAHANEKIEFMWDTVVTDLVGDNKLEAVQVENLKTGASSALALTGLFVAIGHVPNTPLFKGQLDMDDAGYLITHDGAKTNVPGVFGAATSRTTCTARPSRLRARGAWPPSTPSGGSRPVTAEPPSSRRRPIRNVVTTRMVHCAEQLPAAPPIREDRDVR